MSSHITISGIIVDRSKKPILGVSILVGEDIFYSNKDGNFTIILSEDSKGGSLFKIYSKVKNLEL